MLTLIDPERLRVALAALAGAVVYGAFTLVTLFMTGQHVSRMDLVRALANVMAGVLVGVLTAYVIAPWLALLIPWVHLRDEVTVGFFVGALAWEIFPFFLLGAKNRVKREAAKQAGTIGEAG